MPQNKSTPSPDQWGLLPSGRNLRFLFSLLWDADSFLLVATCLLRLVRAALPILLLWIPKLIVDTLIQNTRGLATRWNIWHLLLAEMGLSLLTDALLRAVGLVDTLLGESFTASVATKIMQHASVLDLATFETAHFHDRLERVRGHTTGRVYLLTMMLNGIQELVTFASLAFGLLLSSPWLVLLLMASTVPTFIGESRFSMLSYAAYFRRAPQRRELEYLRQLAAGSQSAKEIRVFNLGRYLCHRYSLISEIIYNDLIRVSSRRAIAGGVLAMVAAGGYYAGYAILLRNTLLDVITIGQFIFLTGSFARSRSGVERMLATVNEMSEQAALLTDLIEFFATEPQIGASPGAILVPQPLLKGFEFRGVSFNYPGSTRKVVSNITLAIHPNQTIAFVGENGAGKTTLMKLLMRLYDPTEGSIFLEGIDLRYYDLTSLRESVSAVFQDFVRYEVSALHNIGLGNVQKIDDSASAIAAAKESGAHTFIAAMPSGYQQQLGKRFAGGIDLSGGEWQKIALARSYTRNAQLFIFDEPSASLDPRSEAYMAARLTTAIRGQMAVIISHKLSTARKANRIYVLQSGVIVEEGTHDELMLKDGTYAELTKIQQLSQA